MREEDGLFQQIAVFVKGSYLATGSKTGINREHPFAAQRRLHQ
jgi:hypothetical protein